jgi:hypothetical protein
MSSQSEEAEKYRIAAEETLDQIQWCIRYLDRIGKSKIADVVAANSETIRHQMREA